MVAILIISPMLLTISSDAPELDLKCWESPFEIGVAPQNREPEGEQIDPIEKVEKGFLLSPRTAYAVYWRLQCLNLWPVLAQVKLNEQKSLHRYELDREKDLVDQNLKEAIAEPASGPSWSNTVLAVGGSFVVGLVIGGVAVFAALD